MAEGDLFIAEPVAARFVGRLAATAAAMESAAAILKDWSPAGTGRPVPAGDLGERRGQLAAAVAQIQKVAGELTDGAPELERWLAQMEQLQSQILERLRRDGAPGPPAAPFAPDAITFFNDPHTQAFIRSAWTAAND